MWVQLDSAYIVETSDVDYNWDTMRWNRVLLCRLRAFYDYDQPCCVALCPSSSFQRNCRQLLWLHRCGGIHVQKHGYSPIQFDVLWGGMMRCNLMLCDVRSCHVTLCYFVLVVYTYSDNVYAYIQQLYIKKHIKIKIKMNICLYKYIYNYVYFFT